jgi:hypothetical protein
LEINMNKPIRMISGTVALIAVVPAALAASLAVNITEAVFTTINDVRSSIASYYRHLTKE